MTRRAGVYLSEKVVCQTYHPPNHAWASQLGEPVLGEPSNEVGRAIKRGWGEPSNEVGASHQTRLGRAIKRGWGEPSNEVGASHQTRLGEPLNHSGRLLQSCALALRCQLGTCPLGTSSACSARCLLGTFSARSALHPLHGASSAPG